MKIKSNKAINDLCSELGEGYNVDVVDGERVINYDLGNDFNVLIRDINDKKKINDVMMLLLFRAPNIIVKTVANIKRSDILNNVSEMESFSKELYNSYYDIKPKKKRGRKAKITDLVNVQEPLNVVLGTRKLAKKNSKKLEETNSIMISGNIKANKKKADPEMYY